VSGDPVSPPLPEAVRAREIWHEDVLTERELSIFERGRQSGVLQAEAAAKQGRMEELSYIPERDGRRCVEHPHSDHELVCLTCMGQSRCTTCGQPVDVEQAMSDPITDVASHPPPTPEA
jgi:hypothetical protein